MDLKNKETRREKVLFYHLNSFAVSDQVKRSSKVRERKRAEVGSVPWARSWACLRLQACGPALACCHHRHPHGQELSSPTACCPGPSLAALEIKTTSWLPPNPGLSFLLPHTLLISQLTRTLSIWALTAPSLQPKSNLFFFLIGG